jgi:hypothetical protein
MRNHLRITILGSLALALTAGACMVDEDLEGTAEQAALEEAALEEAALEEAALDEAALDEAAPADTDDTSDPADMESDVYAKPGSGPVTTSLSRGRARVGWPAAGIDICGDGCFMCFYPNEYDKVFHQNHIVNVLAICGDAAWVQDNYGNDGMMRKDALYNW